MNNLKYPSYNEIRESHAPRREYECYLVVNRYFFRPPAFLAIWVLVRLGVSSEAASWLSGLAALVGFVCLLLPGPPLLFYGVMFLALFNFFDCVDGGIARAMRTRNPYGRFLDSIMWWVDMLFWTVIGVTVWRVPELRALSGALGVDPGAWLAVGALSAFFAAYAAYLESTFDQVLRPHWEAILRGEGLTPASTPLEGKPGPEVLLRVIFHNLRVRETHYLLLAAAFATGSADILLSAFLLFNAGHVAALLVVYCRRGRRVYSAGLGRDKAGA